MIAAAEDSTLEAMTNSLLQVSSTFLVQQHELQEMHNRMQKELARTVRSSKNPLTGEGGAGERQAAGEAMDVVRSKEATAATAATAVMMVAVVAVVMAAVVASWAAVAFAVVAVHKGALL